MRVIDYDPLTGMKTMFHPGDDGKFVIERLQDGQHVQNILDAATTLRNDDGYRSDGIKNCWMHACIIPQGVMAKLYTEYNLQPLRQGKEVLKIIQRDFPWLMTATGKYA